MRPDILNKWDMMQAAFVMYAIFSHANICTVLCPFFNFCTPDYIYIICCCTDLYIYRFASTDFHKLIFVQTCISYFFSFHYHNIIVYHYSANSISTEINLHSYSCWHYFIKKFKIFHQTSSISVCMHYTVECLHFIKFFFVYAAAKNT